VGPVEDCEDRNANGDPYDDASWQPVLPPAVGDFSRVWPLLADLDLCMRREQADSCLEVR
jgi:hypothetical protein